MVVQKTEVRTAASFDLWPEETQPRVALEPGAVFALRAAGASRRATQRQKAPGLWWYSDRAVLQAVGRVQRACCVRETAGNWALRWGWLQWVGAATERRTCEGSRCCWVTQAGRA